MSFTRYGCSWKDGTNDLAIEFYAIKVKGNWMNKNGYKCGNGLSFHLEAAKKLIWPWIENHRWANLCRDEISKNKVAVLIGPASSSKTNSAAWTKLLCYYASPNDTLVLVSSTDMRSLELRVWGEIKKLHQNAKDSRFGKYIPGNLIESKVCIATDNIDSGRVRDLRKGVVAVPTIQGGKFIGLGKWIGIKQKNVHLIADEAQFMGGSFLSAFSNLDKNENFSAVVLGNPSDIFDPLGKAAEPLDGWEPHLEPTKTDTWDTRFMGGRCVNLVGTDSPNFDFPDIPTPRFPFLISRSKIESTAAFWGKDSSEYYSQCVGVMKISQLARRIITPQICRKFGALDDVVWSGSPRTRIAGLDAAYGGDRCVLRHADFGTDVEGRLILSFSPYVIVPVKVSSEHPPEDQIAVFCKAYCGDHSIKPENFFYDSTGRGSLGTSFARIWSSQINPVEFGGKPTNRPVSLDLYIHDFKTGLRRLKLCHEHYSKFVSELWFSVRYAIEAGQVRNMGEEVMDEGCMREYRRVNDSKIEIETKREMKERVGRSPDLFDCTTIVTEGARRRGFTIKKMTNDSGEDETSGWFKELQRKLAEARNRHALNHAA